MNKWHEAHAYVWWLLVRVCFISCCVTSMNVLVRNWVWPFLSACVSVNTSTSLRAGPQAMAFSSKLPTQAGERSEHVLLRMKCVSVSVFCEQTSSLSTRKKEVSACAAPAAANEPTALPPRCRRASCKQTLEKQTAVRVCVCVCVCVCLFVCVCLLCWCGCGCVQCRTNQWRHNVPIGVPGWRRCSLTARTSSRTQSECSAHPLVALQNFDKR